MGTTEGNTPGDGTPGDGYVAQECTVTKGTTGAKVLKGTVLAATGVIEGGEVLVNEQGSIACVDKSCANAAGYEGATVVTCPDGIISPGLINPHDHITFANNPPKPHGNERYEHRHDWRKGARGHTKISTIGSAPQDVVRFAELRFIMSGATSAASAGGVKGLIRNYDGSNDMLEGLAVPRANSDTFPLGDSDGKMLASTCNYSSGRTTTAEVMKENGYLPHISEGVDAETRNEFVCQSQGNNDLIQAQTAVVHGIALQPADIAKYRERQTALIWSPRSNIDLYGNTAPVTVYDSLGVQIALGTDWVPSGSMNMARELRCADELNKKYFGGHFSDKALWQMVTVNAAFAVGAHRVVGILKPGYAADIAIFRGNPAAPYRAVIDAGVEDVALVFRGGRVLYGDDKLVKAIDDTCEALDVCGVPKLACVKSDTGRSLADVRVAGEAIYPLFFCKNQVPTSEPSCVPYRDSYAQGITASDKDGDGVPDAEDNCPTVFNPKRPVDGDQQANADGDAEGDACDKCPLDNGASCNKVSADDIDGDGVDNAVDTCPEQPNPDQGGGCQ